MHSLVDKLKWFYKNARCYNKIYNKMHFICQHPKSIIFLLHVSALCHYHKRSQGLQVFRYKLITVIYLQAIKKLGLPELDSSWNVTAHGDAREGKWRGNWRMEWVASTLHTTSEHGVSTITTAGAQTSTASSRLNWSPRRFKWIHPLRRKTKYGFCACAITFQLTSTYIRFTSSEL